MPNAYPKSSLFEATASSAPIIPSEMETPHSPGLPKPKVSKPFENQFSSLANLVAMYAFIAVTDINRRKSSSGLSMGRTSRGPTEKREVTACIPIHRLDDAIPSEARLPEFLFMAILWRTIVAMRIIPATPTSPNSVPAVEPTARRTRVDWAAIAS